MNTKAINEVISGRKDGSPTEKKDIVGLRRRAALQRRKKENYRIKKERVRNIEQ